MFNNILGSAQYRWIRFFNSNMFFFFINSQTTTVPISAREEHLERGSKATLCYHKPGSVLFSAKNGGACHYRPSPPPWTAASAARRESAPPNVSAGNSTNSPWCCRRNRYISAKLSNRHLKRNILGK